MYYFAYQYASFELIECKETRMITKNNLVFLFFSVVIFYLVGFVQRQEIALLYSLFAVAFLVYLWLVRQAISFKMLLFWGFAVRAVCLFAIPALSDDFYRFIWDGRLLAHGINPYLILPTEFVKTSDFQIIIGDFVIFQKLNSPNYYTVYPPLNQAIFGLSVWLSGSSILLNIIWLRVFIIAAEISNIYLLNKLTPNNAKWYVFNPLVIVELTGNLHFEGVMIGFVVWAFYLFKKQKLVFSAIALACAVSIKLVPLVFMPLLISYLWKNNGKSRWKAIIQYTIIVGSFTALLFLPFAEKALFQKLFSSVNLYFQKFEFNGSIYYIVRFLGYQVYGYNIIVQAGILLSLIAFLLILKVSFSSLDIHIKAVFVLSIYFFFATTIHPWYITTLVALASLTQLRYPMLWAALIPLTYFSYTTIPYQENLLLVTIEYTAVVLLLFFEIKKYVAIK